jgi:hypothetical protein
MIELGREFYTRNDIELMRTSLLQYFTLLGQSTEKMETMEEFIGYFLESVDPVSKESH